MTLPTKRDLWEAQNKYWPDSDLLSGAEVLNWAEDRNDRRRAETYRAIAFTIVHPVGIWYRTKDGHMGFRYGTHGGEYISGFDDI